MFVPFFWTGKTDFWLSYYCRLWPNQNFAGAYDDCRCAGRFATVCSRVGHVYICDDIYYNLVPVRGVSIPKSRLSLRLFQRPCLPSRIETMKPSEHVSLRSGTENDHRSPPMFSAPGALKRKRLSNYAPKRCVDRFLQGLWRYSAKKAISLYFRQQIFF